MRKTLKKSFDDLYKSEELYWGLKPSKIIIEILKYKDRGNVLDLGCGEGRNAIFLAKRGFNVVGIDISKEGIKKFLYLAKKYEIKVIGKVGDISRLKFRRKFDVIISTSTLHFLQKKEAYNLIKKIKEHTSENGLNAISVFTENNPYKNFPYLFKRSELYEMYKDWNVLFYKELMTSLEQHNGGEKHRHSIAIIIARKKF